MENKLLAGIPASDRHSVQLCCPETAARPGVPSPAKPWHLPLLPLKSAFYCPQGWREEQKDARAVGRVAVVRQGGVCSHPGSGQGSTLCSWLCLTIPRGPQHLSGGQFHAPADTESLSLWPPGAPGTISCSLASTRAQTLSK